VPLAGLGVLDLALNKPANARGRKRRPIGRVLSEGVFQEAADVKRIAVTRGRGEPTNLLKIIIEPLDPLVRRRARRGLAEDSPGLQKLHDVT
jgi:hypothetical protein